MVDSPFAVNVPATLQDVFLIEKDSKRFPDTKGWAYAVFDYQPASGTFTPDPTGTVNCGFACHTVVKDKDYIFFTRTRSGRASPKRISDGEPYTANAGLATLWRAPTHGSVGWAANEAWRRN
jgi:hypothetical protein